MSDNCRFVAKAEPSGNWIEEDRQRQKVVATFYNCWPNYTGVKACAEHCALYFNHLEAKK